MITFGFNTLAMLTYGLGNRMARWIHPIIRPSIRIDFVDKSVPVSFEDIELTFEEGEIRVKGR